MEHGRLTEEEMKQRQDHRRLKPSENQLQQQHHPQQPQKCPRCESLNTKFCYYNNYSLSQPRYFCKACRRYWTRGGTLRNVPIGGGCRKGKRSKVSSSISQPSQPPLPLPPPHAHQMPLSTKGLGNLGIPSMTSYYTGGGFLSSLAQMPFNQPLNIGGQFGSYSSLALLQGLNLSSCSSEQVQTQQIQKQNEFYQMGNQSFMQQNRPLGSWNQNLINSSPTNSSAANPSGTSLNRNQWPDVS